MTSATTDRRLGLSGSSAIKTPCYAATTANITLSGEQTIDSLSVTSGKRVLVKNQTTGADNGIYVCDTGSWSRDLDFDGSYDAQCGTLIFVTNGSANGAGLFQLTTADTITIGSTSLTFTKIATLAGGSVTQTNVQNGQFIEVAGVAGTNTITGTTVGTAPAALGHGQYVFFVPANTNTSSVTFNRDAIGGINVFYNGAALIGGELVQNIPALLYHDGTQYQLVATAFASMNFQTQGSVTAASTVNLDTAKVYSQITGSTTINAITLGNGRIRFVEFASTPQITNGASLVCITGSNITARAGDTAIFAGEAAGVVRMISYSRADGTLLSSTGSFTATLTGCTTSPTATAVYSVTNNVVTLFIPSLLATSNTTACTITGAPAAIRPTTQHATIPCIVTDNGSAASLACDIETSGTVTLRGPGFSTTGFTNSGTKGNSLGSTITYNLN